MYTPIVTWRQGGQLGATSLRVFVFTLAAFVIGGCTAGFSDAEVESALRDLQPAFTPQEEAEFLERCVLEAGYSGEVIVHPAGSVELLGSAELGGTELMDQCIEESEEHFERPPPLDDRRLQATAMYQLQILAAECVETELGFEANLPSLERYVDSGGNWNMYDEILKSYPSSMPDQWDEWQETCPQNLWAYYNS